MWDRVLRLLAVSCRHGHLFATVPSGLFQTTRLQSYRVGGRHRRTSPGHYVVCLDCGKHFTYDWSQMRVMR